MDSKNLSLTHNTSRDATHHEFDVQEGSILVGNNQPVGSPTIRSTAKGVTYPNVQAAIDDVASLYELPLNTVIITDDGIAPGGRPQQDEFKFAGIVSYPGKSTNDPVQFNFLGFAVTVLVGETGEMVAAKVLRELQIAMANKLVINRVNFGASNDILQIVYNDCQKHVIEEFVECGIRITQTVLTPARTGYGVWSRLGTQTIKLDGATGDSVLYYYKRVS
ncbi:GP11 baseplate wedge protein [Acinetobacter baumannii]|uniref:Baseplate wedge subunit and tail pin n=1 Tax=Acinetobacter phage AbTZA1 TaxID=2500827 RepID=A0A3T0IGS9_9CAUD|nr:baseplate wedge subunit [Acinetobacter phage AbTZA1]AZU98598.1 hypothetical protein [Acinetobacter phage AbTZA1]SSU39174.1 GP11 baseplate wedge protein [Acinetobacter baumannii]